MRKLFSFVMLLLISAAAMAQNGEKYQIYVDEKSGNAKVFSCNEVDSITFGKVKSDLTVPVTMISSTPISLTLRFDMPKECSKYYVYCATEDHAVAPDFL